MQTYTYAVKPIHGDHGFSDLHSCTQLGGPPPDPQTFMERTCTNVHSWEVRITRLSADRHCLRTVPRPCVLWLHSGMGGAGMHAPIPWPLLIRDENSL